MFLACPRCAGRLRVLATIQDQAGGPHHPRPPRPRALRRAARPRHTRTCLDPL